MWFGQNPSGSGIDHSQNPFTQVGPVRGSEGQLELAVTGRFPGRPAVHPTNMTIKAVCATCNNGWMAELEAKVEPLVQRLLSGDRKVQFTRAEVRLLVRWCQKTLAVLDRWNPEARCVTPEVYSAVCADEPPPGTWDIRIARVEPGMEWAFCHAPHALVLAPDPREGEEPEVPDVEAAQQIVGVQSMFCIGDLLFMVRYSPHQFRGAAALDADYYQIRQPPTTLLGRDARRIFKPNSLPRYNADDWDGWTLWSVSKEPMTTAVAIGTDADGSTYVDDIRVVFADKGWEIGDATAHPINVSEVMSQPVRWAE